MNCLTWNLEWTTPKSRRADLIQQHVAAANPDVACFTELLRDFMPPGHLIEAAPDYGYPIQDGRRKVLLWSREPWTEADAVGDETMPSGRFISGITGGVRFVGVCIPWKDAHVKTGRCDREPWEDHLSYCKGLARVLTRYAGLPIPVCVLGDYNQRIPRISQPVPVFEALMAAIPGRFNIATAGLTDAEGFNFIDHITVSPDLQVSINGILPKSASDGTRLSDHAGVHATIQRVV
jgi:exonuclease III